MQKKLNIHVHPFTTISYHTVRLNQVISDIGTCGNNCIAVEMWMGCEIMILDVPHVDSTSQPWHLIQFTQVPR